MAKNKKNKKESPRVITTRIKLEKYKKNKKRLNKLNIGVLCGLIAATAICLLTLKRPTKSEMEHRELAKFPTFSLKSYFSGQYMADISTYFRDTVPFRESLLTAENYLMTACGIKTDHITFHGDIAVIDENSGTTETAVAGTSVTEAPPKVIEPENTSTETEVPTETADLGYDLSSSHTETDDDTADLTEFTHNGIVVMDNVGLMLFGGNNTQGTRYAGIINKYKELLGPDVNVYNLVTPTSVEFWLPEKYSRYSASEKDCIDNIYNHLSPDVTPINAYDVLEQHKDEYIFYRTDHHWSQLGAYYAYTAFCDTLGLECPTLDMYEHKSKEGFVGSLYGYSGDVALKDNPDRFDYYIPPDEYEATVYNYKTVQPDGRGMLFHEYAKGESCYGTFLGGDAFHFKITTEHKNGRKIAVFKESFGNAFVPFLVSNFEEIYVIDIRYFGTNAVSYLKKVGITDVLFLDNIFAANTSSLIDDIERLQTNVTGSVTTTAKKKETAAETTVKTSETTVKNSGKVKQTETGAKAKKEKPSETKKKQPSETSPPKATEKTAVTPSEQ